MVIIKVHRLLEIISMMPDIVMLQAHWLTPVNICRFDTDFPQYLCYGSSAMCSAVQSGVITWPTIWWRDDHCQSET